jgi:hypothetical protein
MRNTKPELKQDACRGARKIKLLANTQHSEKSVQMSYNGAQMSYRQSHSKLRSGRQSIDDNIDGARRSNMIRH